MKKIWLLPYTIFLVLCFSCSKDIDMMRRRGKKNNRLLNKKSRYMYRLFFYHEINLFFDELHHDDISRNKCQFIIPYIKVCRRL